MWCRGRRATGRTEVVVAAAVVVVVGVAPAVGLRAATPERVARPERPSEFVGAKSREERLFGAACLKLKLKIRALGEGGQEVYRGALQDLGLRDEEVEA